MKRKTKKPTVKPKETSLQIMHRKSREATAASHAEFATMVAEQEAERAREPSPNPLFDLPEEQRAKLFAWLRECPYDDAVRHILKDQGLAEVTPDQLSDFFQQEAENHWERRIERAAYEANALVRLVG